MKKRPEPITQFSITTDIAMLVIFAFKARKRRRNS